MSLAGDHFTKGLRTYLFALPAIFWFVHPWFFIAGSMAVAGVIFRMDFHSKTLAAMRGDEPEKG